jgi:general secretion pathway protein H
LAGRGFTLIELLVVIVIVGILSSVVVFYMDPNSPERAVDGEMDRLITVVGLASDEAVAENHELGLKIDNDRYQFLVFDDAAQRWQPYTADDSFKTHTLPEGLHLQMVTETKTYLPRSAAAQAASKVEPDVLLLSSGESSNAIIEMSAYDKSSATQRLLIDTMANIKRETGATGGV